MGSRSNGIRFVPRPALAGRIGVTRMTLLSAPAGSGKTVLLRAWAAAEPGPVVWATPERLPALADHDGVLIIDDAHALDERGAAATLAVLERPATRVVLAGRHDPPALGLHRLRLTGDLSELRDLRFT